MEPNADRYTFRFAVSTGLEDEGFSLSYSVFEWLFLNLHNLALWLPAFSLAVLLRVITHKYHHQLIFPTCKLRAKTRTFRAEAF